MSSPTATNRTRPTVRLPIVVALALMVYGAGANIGSNAVVLVAAGIATGTAWSVVVLARRLGRVEVTVGDELVVTEGAVGIPVEVAVPAGLVGTLAAVSTGDGAEQRSLLAVLGQESPACVDGEHPRHTAVLPAAGGRATVTVPVVLRRGEAQRPRLRLEVGDPLGLLRRTRDLDGPLLHVVPAAGVPGRFLAASHEDEADAAAPRALAANGTPDAELRAWRAGEPIRSVDWASSLRTDQLLLRPRSPETVQRRTLGVADGTWDRDELDARCREVWATAERLTALGVAVEVTADGRTVPHGPSAARLLASLPPHATTPSRPLGAAVGAGGAPWRP